MKIYIIGPSGSGKTILANQLSKKTNIEHTNLDDIFWDNKTNSFNIKREETLRNNIYNKVLNKESWIIEGAYISWPKKGFLLADKFVYLNINNRILNQRIILRFIKRKLRIESSAKKETLKQLISLIKWNKQQSLLMKKKINNKEYPNLTILSSTKEINAFINNLAAINQ
ncbi:MAG: AAA family ATPase [Pleomorphochaeta sp.]